jgi:hypothetical protein
MNRILLPAQHPFRGIAEKLNRSHENIKNLEAEIARFFQESEYPVLGDDNGQILPEAIDYDSELLIPLGFSVLSGEIIHHLRSCLDHLIWHFSDVEYRQRHTRWIEFPILKDRPSPTNVFTQYERKVKGIVDTRVLDLIERVQPYSGSEATNSKLLAIHNLDIMDKHRTLVIVSSTTALEIPFEVAQRYGTNVGQNLFMEPADFAAELKRHGKFVPQVAFSDFVGGNLRLSYRLS